MNKITKPFVYFILITIPILGIVIHYGYLRPSIIDAFNNRPDAFINFLLENFYPRFTIEKERFDINFFLKKGDQVLVRFTTLYYIGILILYFYKTSDKFKNKTQHYFQTETSSKNIDILRILFFGYFLFLIGQLCHDLEFMQPLKPFYKPVLWLRMLQIPFPNHLTIIIIGGLWYLLNILILLKIRTVLCTILSLVIFFLIQCWEFSFEKFDHSYATLTYAFILLPFLFDEQNKNASTFNSWSLQLIKIAIASVYLLSSLEKIFTSQLSWLDPETLKTYLFFHETNLSKIIIQYNFICLLISIGTIVLQASFILLLVFPKKKLLWLIGGVLFHTGTLLIMNIGHPLNPWLLVYIFFIDWTSVYDFFSSKFKGLNLRKN